MVYLYSIASKVETLLSDATQRISEIAEGTAGMNNQLNSGAEEIICFSHSN